MAVEVTRAYLRGRFIVLLGGFVLAVTLGAGLMLWQAQKAKNGVKFAAVISEMAEAGRRMFTVCSTAPMPGTARYSSRCS